MCFFKSAKYVACYENIEALLYAYKYWLKMYNQ